MHFYTYVILFYLVAAILIKDVDGAPLQNDNHDDEVTNSSDVGEAQAQNSLPIVLFAALEAVDKAVIEALERRFSNSEGPSEGTPRRTEVPSAKTSSEESKLLVEQPLFEAVTQAIEEALSLVSTKSTALKNSSNSPIDPTLVENIYREIKDALTRRILVSQTKPDPAASEMPPSAVSPNPDRRIDEPVRGAIDQIDEIVKNSLSRIQTQNPSKVNDELLIQAVDEAVRDSLNQRLPKPIATVKPGFPSREIGLPEVKAEGANFSIPTVDWPELPKPRADGSKPILSLPVRELNDVPLPESLLRAIDVEVRKVLIRKLSGAGFYSTDELLFAPVGHHPINERPTAPAVRYLPHAGSTIPAGHNPTKENSAAPEVRYQSNERPNPPGGRYPSHPSSDIPARYNPTKESYSAPGGLYPSHPSPAVPARYNTTKESSTAPGGRYPPHPSPAIPARYNPTKESSIAPGERYPIFESQSSTAPVRQDPTKERPTAPNKPSTPLVVSSKPLDRPPSETGHSAIKHIPNPQLTEGSSTSSTAKSLPRQVGTSTLPSSNNTNVDHSERKNDDKPPSLVQSSEPSMDSRNTDGEDTSAHRAMTDESKPTDSVTQQKKVQEEESTQGPPKEDLSKSHLSSSTEDEDVIVDKKMLLLRPKESDTESDKANIEINFQNAPINVERFPSEAVLMTFKTEEEAELFRNAVAKSDKIEVSDGESFPRQVWILGLQKEMNEEDLSSSIKETFGKSPKRIRFSKHPDNGDLRVAHIEVSKSLFEKIEANPRVQIRGNTHDIETSVEVKRCSKCWLLGHTSSMCKNPPKSSLAAVSDGNVCFDCKNYNTVLRKQLGVRKAAEQHRKFDHPTDSTTCPTKISLNAQSRKLKQEMPYLNEGEKDESKKRPSEEGTSSTDKATTKN